MLSASVLYTVHAKNVNKATILLPYYSTMPYLSLHYHTITLLYPATVLSYHPTLPCYPTTLPYYPTQLPYYPNTVLPYYPTLLTFFLHVLYMYFHVHTMTAVTHSHNDLHVCLTPVIILTVVSHLPRWINSSISKQHTHVHHWYINHTLMYRYPFIAVWTQCIIPHAIKL